MELIEIKKSIEAKFRRPLPSHIFLDNMRFIDEESRKSFAYNDETYIPFYYWLGRLINSENVLEIGFKLGLLSGNFLKSCKTVNKFLAIQEVKKGEYYSPRLGKANIRDVYKKKFYVHVGSLNDDAFEAKFKSTEFDLVIINEEVSYDKHRAYFDIVWGQMSSNGIIVVEYLRRHKASRIAFDDFCSSKNLEPVRVNTRYGIGLIRKV